MLGPLSLTTVNLALPSIAEAFEVNAKRLSWIPTSFLLSTVICMLPAGKLADIYGRKRFYLCGVLFTGIVSIAASLAQSAETLIFWRFLQGGSVAVFVGSGLAILTAVFPGKNRGAAMGWYAASVYFALTVSPVLGGLVTEYMGWRAVFWIQVPFSLIVAVCVWVAMPGEWSELGRQHGIRRNGTGRSDSDRSNGDLSHSDLSNSDLSHSSRSDHHQHGVNHRQHQTPDDDHVNGSTMRADMRADMRAIGRLFDWKGTLIFAAWATTFVIAVASLPHAYSGFLFAISGLCLVLFIWQQTRSLNPLLPASLFVRARTFSCSLGAAVLMYSASYPLSFLLSLFLQIGQEMTPSKVGLILLLQAMAMAIVAPIAGRISDRFGARVLATLGCLCSVAGFLQIYFADAETPVWVMGIGLVSIGLGYGCFSTPNNSSAMGAVSKQDLGAASSAVNLARVIGNLLGMSVMVVVVQVFIGTQEFSPALRTELAQAVKVWMMIAMTCGLTAALLSFIRGESVV